MELHKAGVPRFRSCMRMKQQPPIAYKIASSVTVSPAILYCQWPWLRPHVTSARYLGLKLFIDAMLNPYHSSPVMDVAYNHTGEWSLRDLAFAAGSPTSLLSTCNCWHPNAVPREQMKSVVGQAMVRGKRSSSEVRDKAKGQDRQQTSSEVKGQGSIKGIIMQNLLRNNK